MYENTIELDCEDFELENLAVLESKLNKFPKVSYALKENGTDVLLSNCAPDSNAAKNEKIKQKWKVQLNEVSKPKSKAMKMRYMDSKKRYKTKLAAENNAFTLKLKSLRQILPGFHSKTDKRGTLEVAAKYIKALQNKIGGAKKDEFMNYFIKKRK